jgi:hypothetical protein
LTFRTMTAALVAAALTLATPLAAQDTTTEIVPTPGLTADKVTDAQVEAFVEALIAVEDLRAAYGQKIAAEQDAGAREDLVAEANEKVVDAVDGVENMSAADYMAIGQAAQQDEALNERIMAQISVVVEERKTTE